MLGRKIQKYVSGAFRVGDELIGLTGFHVGLADMFSLGVGLSGQGDVLKLDNIRISFQSDTRATASATMRYHDLERDESETVSFEFVKEDGDWYIYGGI